MDHNGWFAFLSAVTAFMLAATPFLKEIRHWIWWVLASL
jgi:hypothetical protein